MVTLLTCLYNRYIRNRERPGTESRKGKTMEMVIWAQTRLAENREMFTTGKIDEYIYRQRRNLFLSWAHWHRNKKG